jgi:hypothetical protein
LDNCRHAAVICRPIAIDVATTSLRVARTEKQMGSEKIETRVSWTMLRRAVARKLLRGPIDDGIDEGLGLPYRIQPGGADTDRDRSALSHGPFPPAREAHFDDRESDATMFHERTSVTLGLALLRPAPWAL